MDILWSVWDQGDCGYYMVIFGKVEWVLYSQLKVKVSVNGFGQMDPPLSSVGFIYMKVDKINFGTWLP